MITAKEAKALYDASGIEVKKFIENTVGPKIENSAKEGKVSVFIFLNSVPLYYTMWLTPFEQNVVKELRKLGYLVQCGYDGAEYVPVGLSDDDGDGPMHRNFGLIISWK
jgi:hypothetical protein